ncbi:MAG TPA: TlyA family RNA methyltransferase [Nocardioidaceae bacterium]|nr:TlyA family RNA methyltransferase [Nocardioidaceae bacterium]
MTQAARVDAELVRRGLARSREHAVTLIADGRVRADGRAVTKPAYRVDARSDLAIAADPTDPGYASRAGHKLAGALEAFGPGGLSVRGRRCLDVGASTGGFTDVLLRAGADQVVCLDVGRDQLVARLRADARTVVLEGRNIREVDTFDLGGPVDVAVADVSFISLLLVLPVLAEVALPEADLVVMVKPQFEVGRERLGSGGVVRDPQLRREALRRVAAAAADLGWGVRGVAPSVLPGPSGNVEYFLWLRQGPGSVGSDDLDRAVTDGPDGERVSW